MLSWCSCCGFFKKHLSYDHGHSMSPTFVLKCLWASHANAKYWTDRSFIEDQAKNCAMVPEHFELIKSNDKYTWRYDYVQQIVCHGNLDDTKEKI